MKLKTNYAGHDQAYIRKKQEGLPSWNTAEQLAILKSDMEELCSSDDFPRSGRLLELGCGAGDVSLLFAQKGYQVHGIDIAPTAIAWAKEKAAAQGLKALFETGEVTDLGRYSNASFDIVIDGHCLHCIIGDDRSAVLGETYRILKPGGIFYVNTMSGTPRDPEFMKQYDPKTRCTVSNNGVATRYFGEPKDILKELETAGFKILRHKVRENNTPEDMVDDLFVLAGK